MLSLKAVLIDSEILALSLPWLPLLAVVSVDVRSHRLQQIIIQLTNKQITLNFNT